MDEHKHEREHLERLIDTNGLDTVLGILTNICYGKAEHLQENWQDTNAAKVWDKYGKAIAKAQLFVQTH